ncbi:MAG: flagellar hook-basal body protein [Syntrophobacteraceae bacterium]
MAANMMYTALSGLDVFNEALSVTSNNIANANTTAYKSQSLDFGDMVSGLMQTAYSDDTAQGVGATILGATADQSTGVEQKTNTWSDVMLQGGGFFEVQNPTTTVDSYTRDGSFQVNSAGNLTDMGGNDVLDAKGNVINLNPPTTTPPTTYTSYSIDQSGVVYGLQANGTQTSIAQIGVTTFSNPSALVSDGNNLFSTGVNSGAANLGTVGSGTAGTIVSGALEMSNVDLTQQMVNLIDYQADYQANSKSIATGDNILQTVVNLIQG